MIKLKRIFEQKRDLFLPKNNVAKDCCRYWAE